MKIALKLGWGCLARGFILGLFALVILAIIGGSYAVYQYYRIARTLPSVDGLKDSASQFETTLILDRNGNPLYEILDPSAGRRTYVPLDQISPALVAGTIATEDQDSYTHPGFDPMAIIRALWVNYLSGSRSWHPPPGSPDGRLYDARLRGFPVLDRHRRLE